jgi:hypothetical protein
MVLDLFFLHVLHAPSYCSFTSNLALFSLIVDYWIDIRIYSAFIIIIINLIIDKSRSRYKITIKYWQKYCILNYTRIKPRSRPPQKKKSAYFTHPDFSAAKIGKKKCANYASKYGNFLDITCSLTKPRRMRWITKILWQ